MKKKVFLGILALIVAFCFIGCGDSDDPPPDATLNETGKTIKVTGITGVTLVGGAILKKEEANYPDTVVAVGFNQNGTFTFIKGSATYDEEEGLSKPQYDITKPWNGVGEYYIVLSTKTDGTGDLYFYTADEEILNIQGIADAISEEDDFDIDDFDLAGFDLKDYINYVEFTFTTVKNVTIPWSKFSKIPNTADDFDAIKTAIQEALDGDDDGEDDEEEEEENG